MFLFSFEKDPSTEEIVTMRVRNSLRTVSTIGKAM